MTTGTATWNILDEELAAWRAQGRVATLWWRDDDVGQPCPALDRLLALSARSGVPVALAVIPVRAGAAVARVLARARRWTALQHGYAHADYARPDEPSAELGDHRPGSRTLGELGRGREQLEALLGSRFAPVLVPPWNRISGVLVPTLASLGFRGLSCFAAPGGAAPTPGLVRADCHVDPVDWRRGGALRAEAKVLGALVGHLRARRTGGAGPHEPTGLLTHHWRHDEATWRFLDALFERLRGRDEVRWLSANAVFPA